MDGLLLFLLVAVVIFITWLLSALTWGEAGRKEMAQEVRQAMDEFDDPAQQLAAVRGLLAQYRKGQ